MFAVHVIGLIKTPPIMAAVALSTTALGILVPILRDEGTLDSDFGRLVLSAAAKFALNVVFGAFAAGMVARLATRGEGGAMLRHKLDAVGYGFLIPIFFIVEGMRFDVNALWGSPLVPVQVIALLGLLVFVRGAPVLLYGSLLPQTDRLPFAFYAATGLPLIVVVTEIGVSSGLMASDRAAVLLSAGMISVFLFPMLAERARMRARGGSA